MVPFLQRLHRLLAGSDGPGRRALPAGEFLHPAPLAAVALLVLNDHALKGAGLFPAWLTGKLSDFAGLLFFPLLCTACADCLLLVAARAGLRVDFSLRRWKIGAAAALTGLLFAAIKLWEPAAAALAGVLSALGFDATIVADPTDLVALAILPIPLLLARREIARVPLGRLEALERTAGADEPSIRSGLADTGACGGDLEALAELSRSFAAHLADPAAPAPRRAVDAALARLRNA